MVDCTQAFLLSVRSWLGSEMHPSAICNDRLWSEVGLQAGDRGGREQRSVNGNAQVAGHQFYTAGHGELMAGALGGQIKAARSRSTDDGGHSAADYGT